MAGAPTVRDGAPSSSSAPGGGAGRQWRSKQSGVEYWSGVSAAWRRPGSILERCDQLSDFLDNDFELVRGGGGGGGQDPPSLYVNAAQVHFARPLFLHGVWTSLSCW